MAAAAAAVAMAVTEAAAADMVVGLSANGPFSKMPGTDGHILRRWRRWWWWWRQFDASW